MPNTNTAGNTSTTTAAPAPSSAFSMSADYGDNWDLNGTPIRR